MPWDAKKALIFSRSSVTLLFSCGWVARETGENFSRDTRDDVPSSSLAVLHRNRGIAGGGGHTSGTRRARWAARRISERQTRSAIGRGARDEERAPVATAAAGAYLSTDSAGVAARLCSDGAFWLRRSGLLLRLLLSAGIRRRGGDGLAGTLGDVGHREGLLERGRGVWGRRVGQVLGVEVDGGWYEMRGQRRWRRRLRYMYSGRCFDRARAVLNQRLLRGIHTRRLNFDSGTPKTLALLYTSHQP